jgi:hypothetical protein
MTGIPGSRPGNFHTFRIPPWACEALGRCPSPSSSRPPLPPPPPHLGGMAELRRRGCRAASHTPELAWAQCMCRLKSRVSELAAFPSRQEAPARICFQCPGISLHNRKDDHSGMNNKVPFPQCSHCVFAKPSLCLFIVSTCTIGYFTHIYPSKLVPYSMFWELASADAAKGFLTVTSSICVFDIPWLLRMIRKRFSTLSSSTSRILR